MFTALKLQVNLVGHVHAGRWCALEVVQGTLRVGKLIDVVSRRIVFDDLIDEIVGRFTGLQDFSFAAKSLDRAQLAFTNPWSHDCGEWQPQKPRVIRFADRGIAAGCFKESGVGTDLAIDQRIHDQRPCDTMLETARLGFGFVFQVDGDVRIEWYRQFDQWGDACHLAVAPHDSDGMSDPFCICTGQTMRGVSEGILGSSVGNRQVD